MTNYLALYSFAGRLPDLHGSGPPRYASHHVDPPGDEGKDSQAGKKDLWIIHTVTNHPKWMRAMKFAIQSH